jgi:hypothetical protein
VATYSIPTIGEEPGQEPVKPTVRRMADTILGRKPDVMAAFDKGAGAQLVLEDIPPVWPKNPVPPSGGASRRKPAATPTRQRPPGAEDLEGLFATGLILLLTFAVGDWASPTADEATAIARPMANIMARRIDLAARLGKDASDTIALAIAVLSYLARVGPVAAERMRHGFEERRQRAEQSRVTRPGQPADRPDDGGGADSMAAGPDNGSGTFSGSPIDPFHALATARNLGLGGASGGAGNAPFGNPPVADR